MHNAYMLFTTNDIDKNGKKEFWIGGDSYYKGIGVTRSTCFEAAADNQYQEVGRIDLEGVFSFSAGNASAVDFDNDGVEELFICIDQHVLIFKFAGT